MTLKIDSNNKCRISFGENIQTAKVIKLAINSGLGNYNDILDVSRAMCKEPRTDISRRYGFQEVLEQCREKLTEKYPVFTDIVKSYEKKFNNHKRSERYTQKWLNKQVKKVGLAEVDVPSFSPNFLKVQRAMDEDYMATHAF